MDRGPDFLALAERELYPGVPYRRLSPEQRATAVALAVRRAGIALHARNRKGATPRGDPAKRAAACYLGRHDEAA